MTEPTTVFVDKIASSLVNLELGHEQQVVQPETVNIGDVVVVRTLTDNATYNKLELSSGRMARIKHHDVIMGALGRRRALRGFVGEVPQELKIGDTLHVLNLGGVIGRCVGSFHAYGNAIEAEFLGTVVQNGEVLNLRQTALPEVEKITSPVPLVLIAGAAMNSGKTQVATSLVKQFYRNGYKVAAAKLSGVACMRDTLDMEDHGALQTLSFLDCGYPSTVGVEDVAPITRSIVETLVKKEPDVIVIEMGDGILGGYHVDTIFQHADIMDNCGAVIFCASDFVGAWGGIELLKRRGVTVDVVCGSCTDSQMGVDYIQEKMATRAANAINGGETLFTYVEESINAWKQSK